MKNNQLDLTNPEDVRRGKKYLCAKVPAAYRFYIDDEKFNLIGKLKETGEQMTFILPKDKRLKTILALIGLKVALQSSPMSAREHMPEDRFNALNDRYGEILRGKIIYTKVRKSKPRLQITMSELKKRMRKLSPETIDSVKPFLKELGLEDL